ncbi:hypothetical protein PAAG_09021 [Paracoccidioides lutzii Pb01]|uniref:Phosphatidate phosphatase APP1 catalytic domain-containing protein n=1 Tax=Paracoccidioides lutzii (strain ATCC MYA-826 / Pb01) TaxID=502779 RepID=C1HE28_PARBA|nr:hypothetical protein PAAG_09021 [Paracoccidioides lutzii Pb01]EEH40568.2 hypothetical protein PAAG_09021 [Paracoccidioides lutzii Pb01]
MFGVFTCGNTSSEMWTHLAGCSRSFVFTILLCFCLGSLAALAADPTPDDFFQSSEPIYISTSSDWMRFLGDIEKSVRSKLRFFSPKGPSPINREANIFQIFPTPQELKNSVNGSKGLLKLAPTEVLTISGYGNWTDSGWTLRFRGSVYKQPNISNHMLHALASLFLLGASLKKFPPAHYAHALNATRSVLMIKQSHSKVSFHVTPDMDQDAAGAGLEGTPVEGLNIDIPGLTNLEGDFDSFIEIRNVSGAFPIPGNETRKTQRLKLYSRGTDTGNSTAYLIPPEGLTLISDIDDVLRVSKIFSIQEGLANLFGRPFFPWMNMPEIFANWSHSLPDLHFHYLTTSPEQLTRPYMDYIFRTYPVGSFDTRIVNLTDLKATWAIREFLLDKIFQTFPKRKFIIVGDTTNLDIMSGYPRLVTKYPGQVQCIFLRNTSATDSANRVPYNTKGFKGMDQQMFMFFRVPDDLKGLDIENGNCYNESVPQNLTFGWQGLSLGGGPP